MRVPPNVRSRAVTEVAPSDEATEVDSLLVGWQLNDPGEFDRELDDDARRLRDEDLREARFEHTRFASGTGQFDLRSGDPAGPGLAEPLPEAASSPVALIMVRKVVCVRGDLDASEARSRMLARGASGLPVVDDWGRPIGVISKSDLVEHEITAQPSGRRVIDIMTPLVFSLAPDASIGQAAALMAYEGIHRVVIVDRGGYVVGLVSSIDVARWLGSQAGHPVGQEL